MRGGAGYRRPFRWHSLTQGSPHLQNKDGWVTPERDKTTSWAPVTVKASWTSQGQPLCKD